MYRDYSRELVPRAKRLRKEMTPQERRLWHCFLKVYPVKFVRQRVFGHYIVDFYCAAARLAVEVDGGQHFEEAGLTEDRRRTEYLNSVGIEVFRVSNADVNARFQAVCEGIDRFVQERLGAPGDC